jgi:hypothetical protein
MTDRTGPTPARAEIPPSRREFLARAGRTAVVVPPTVGLVAALGAKPSEAKPRYGKADRQARKETKRAERMARREDKQSAREARRGGGEAATATE